MRKENVVLYKVDQHVDIIALNRPQQRNIFLVESFERLGQQFKEIDQNPDVGSMMQGAQKPGAANVLTLAF